MSEHPSRAGAPVQRLHGRLVARVGMNGGAPQATSISASYTIGKFHCTVALGTSPWLSRPVAEPGHRGGHALQRWRHARARQARRA